MKKSITHYKQLFLCFALSIISTSVFAQSFTEDFDDITTLIGNGWAMQNNSQPVGVIDWFQGNNNVFNAYNGAAAAYIAANFNNTSGSGDISNWLISPTRTFKNGDVITFYTRTVNLPLYADRLQVRMSTNGASTDVGATASSVGDFTDLLLDIDPLLVATDYPNTWTQYTITISGLGGPTSGRFAFRYFVTNGGPTGANSNYIGIDNVVYTNQSCPTVTVNLGGPYTQCSGSVTLDAGNPGVGYLWSTIETSQIISVNSSGTYSVTITDNNGCTGEGSANVTIIPPPLNTSDYTICQGNPVPLGEGLKSNGCGTIVTSFTGQTTLADPVFNRSTNGFVYSASGVGSAVHYATHLFSVGTTGSYTFTVCGFDTYLHIYKESFNPSFPATNFLVANDDGAACPGGSQATITLTAGVTYVFLVTGYGNNDVGSYTATFTGAGPVYSGPAISPLWFSQSSGGPLIATGQVFNPVGTSYLPNTNTPGTYTFYTACPSTPDCRISLNFVINPTPTVNLGGPHNQCGGSITLDAGAGYSSYNWSDGNTTQTTEATTSGSYLITVTNSFSCSTTVSTEVYIQPVPVVNLGSDIVQCNGTVTLDAGNPGANYSWSNGANTQTITVNSTSNYSVTVINTNSGCANSSSVNVTINSSPIVDLGSDITQCGGTALLDAGNTGANYLWSTGATTQTITVGATGIYRVTVTNGNNCSATGSKNVTIHSFPSLGVDKIDSICSGITVDLNNYFLNTGYASYSWNTANPSSVGAGNYQLIVANSGGCQDTANVVITEKEKPVLGPDLHDSVCVGYTFDLWNVYPNNIAYAAYIWNTPTPAAVTPGNYVLIVSNASGCKDTAEAYITQRQQPDLGVDKADSICLGTTLNLLDYFPNNDYAAYVWNTADPQNVTAGIYTLIVSNFSGCYDTATITVTTKQHPIVTLNMKNEMCYTEPAFTLNEGLPIGGNYYIDNIPAVVFDPVQIGIGVHQIKYVYSNPQGCIDSAEIAFTVHPQPFVTTLQAPALCTGSPALNLDNYIIPTGGVYAGLGVDQHFFYPSLTGAGDFTLTYYYTDQYGCKDTSVYPITVQKSVHVSLDVSDVDYTICQGDEVTFTASGAEFYEFFVNGESKGTPSTNNTFTTTTLNNHDKVFVVGSNDCSTDTSESIVMDIIANPYVYAGLDTTIALGETIMLNTKASGSSSLLYHWSPNFYLNFANVPNPVYSGPDTTTFIVKVTDIYGCWGADTITVNVYVPDNVLLPNLLTTNGDGKNDIWKLNSKIPLAQSNLVIFNRWGEIVYEVSDYQNNWDGTYKSTGKKLPDGTYYYVLKVPLQNNHIYKGAINILNSDAK